MITRGNTLVNPFFKIFFKKICPVNCVSYIATRKIFFYGPVFLDFSGLGGPFQNDFIAMQAASAPAIRSTCGQLSRLAIRQGQRQQHGPP